MRTWWGNRLDLLQAAIGLETYDSRNLRYGRGNKPYQALVPISARPFQSVRAMEHRSTYLDP